MSDVTERLNRLDTCAVSDALDALGLQGVLADVNPVTLPRRVAGRVLTVELGPADGATPGRHLCTSAIEAARRGDIIVVAHQRRTDCAGWGGNLSRAAARQGVAATIVHGAVRDIDESRALGYAVFATAVTPLTARGRAAELSWGGPVHLASLTIATGDYVVADSTGVAFLPAAALARVVQKAEEIASHEAAMAAAIDRGVAAGDAMGASYESLLQTQGDQTLRSFP